MEKNDNIKFKRSIKASNAILVVLLCLGSVLIGAVTLTINLKFANGDYHSTGDKLEYARVPITGAKIIHLSNVRNCRIISSDSLRLEVRRENRKNLTAAFSKDTLQVRLSTSTGKRNDELVVYLPTGATVIADSSNIDLKGGRDFLKRPSFSFVLNRSSLTSTARGYHTFFQKLEIEGSGNSSVRMLERVHIVALDLSNVYDAKLAEGFQIEALNSSFDKRGNVMVLKNEGLITINSSK